MAGATLSAVLAEIKANPGTFYVYVLLRPDGAPFYVGKGHRARVIAHAWEAKKGRRGHKCSIIRKAWSAGQDIAYRIDSFHSDGASALAREIALIAEIGRRSAGMGPLVNGTDGGDGLNNPSRELRENQRRVKLAFYADPANRRIVAERTKEAMARPEVRERSIRGLKAHYADPAARGLQRQRALELRVRDPDHDKRIAATKKRNFQDPQKRQAFQEKVARAWTPERRAANGERKRQEMAQPSAKAIHAIVRERLAADPDYRRGLAAKATERADRLREVMDWTALRLRMISADIEPPSGHAPIREWYAFNAEIDAMCAAGVVSTLALRPGWYLKRNLVADKAREVGNRPGSLVKFRARMERHNADPVAKAARVAKARVAHLARREETSRQVRESFEARRAIRARCEAHARRAEVAVTLPSLKAGRAVWLQVEAELMASLPAGTP